MSFRAPFGTAQTAGWFGEPATLPTLPAFRFECPGGCTPNAANECIGIIRRAIHDAIWLAENAADKLTARDNEALRLFRFFFGAPLLQVPWANNRPAADLVADRFRAAARGFRTRVPHIRCSTQDGCNAFVDADAPASAANPLPRNTIFVCPPFWGGPPPGNVVTFWRAAILLHEMFHLLYWRFFSHQETLLPGDAEERRRDNARCYEAFALRVAGHGSNTGDVAACRARGA